MAGGILHRWALRMAVLGEFSQRWISWRFTVLEYPLGSSCVRGVCTCLESSLCAPFAFYHSWVPLPSTLSSSDFSTSRALLSCPSNVHQLILIVLVLSGEKLKIRPLSGSFAPKWNTGMKMQQLIIWGGTPAPWFLNDPTKTAAIITGMAQCSLAHSKWVVRTLPPSLEQISHLKRQKVLQGQSTETFQGKAQIRALWYTHVF